MAVAERTIAVLVSVEIVAEFSDQSELEAELSKPEVMTKLREFVANSVRLRERNEGTDIWIDDNREILISEAVEITPVEG